MNVQRISLGRHLAGFGSWWVGELAAMTPKPVRRALRGRRDQLVLELEDGVLILKRWTGDGLVEIGRMALSGAAEGEQRQVLRELLAGSGAKTKHVALLLSRRRGLRKLLSLPLAAEENLDQVLRFEMDRQTPFRADEVYFDHRIRSRRKDAGRIEVELVVLPRQTVDEALDRVRALGFAPKVVGVAWDDKQDPNAFNLLPRSHAAAGRRGGRRAVFLLALIAIGLLVAIVYVPMERQQRLLSALEAETAAALEEAEAARRLREQIDQAIAQGRLIVLKKMEQPSVVHILDEVTALLDDDTWLIRMRMSGTEVQIFGYSNAASNLIGAIEESPMFGSAQFRAPVTRDPRVEAERFHLAFQVARATPQMAGATSPDAAGERR